MEFVSDATNKMPKAYASTHTQTHTHTHVRSPYAHPNKEERGPTNCLLLVFRMCFLECLVLGRAFLIRLPAVEHVRDRLGLKARQMSGDAVGFELRRNGLCHFLLDFKEFLGSFLPVRVQSTVSCMSHRGRRCNLFILRNFEFFLVFS